MKKSFRIPRSRVVGKKLADLKAGILEETGSEDQAASILRSMDRMGTDPSILAYEMTLETRPSKIGTAVAATWRVHADRGEVPEPPAEEESAEA